MVMGHLLGTGMIADIKEIQSMRIHNGDEAQVSLFPSRKSVPQRKQRIKIGHRFLLRAKEQLIESQQYQQVTRGFHAAAITEIDTENFLACEDISRHSVVDKTVGEAAMKGINYAKSLLMVTGRLSSSIVKKATHIGIPILASLTVATDAGIAIAKANDLTLVGSLTNSKFWLYHEGKAQIG
jgi:FdhD protein